MFKTHPSVVKLETSFINNKNNKGLGLQPVGNLLENNFNEINILWSPFGSSESKAPFH